MSGVPPKLWRSQASKAAVTIKRRRFPKKYADRYFVRLKDSNIADRINEISERYQIPAVLQTGRVTIMAPQSLNLQADGDQTIGFLQTIREIVPLNVSQIAVRLDDLKRMSPTCAVLFASEMDRLKRVRGGSQTIPAENAWEPTIRKMLNEIGVFDLVEVANKPQPEISSSSEKFLTIRSATRVDMERALKSLISEVDSIREFVECNPHLFGAITEAITNVSQWAYNGFEQSVPEVIRGRWWFLASYNLERRRFSILVFDHGQGIPTTLRRIGWEKLAKFLPNEMFTDADAIEAAFKIPRSATGEQHRGKGLPEMRALLEKFSRGSMRVVSGRGEYIYDCGDGSIAKKTYRHDIGGTLIAWEIFEADK